MARGRRLVVVLVHAAVLVGAAAAQDADTVSYPQWEQDLVLMLSGSQAGFQNWTEGGINALAAKTQMDGRFTRTSENWRQSYETRLGFGILKQDTLLRKAEDVLRMKGQIRYGGESVLDRFNPTVAAELRTQFAPGFNYDKNPFEDGRPPPVKVSDFFAPATFTQSLGLSYDSDVGFAQRMGIAAKETVVLIERFRSLYGQERSEAIRFQLGIESKTELDREVFTNVQVKSSLGLFAAFNQDELPDILWENAVILRVNDWLNANVEAVALYDRDISGAVQFKEIFSIGISMAIM